MHPLRKRTFLASPFFVEFLQSAPPGPGYSSADQQLIVDLARYWHPGGGVGENYDKDIQFAAPPATLPTLTVSRFSYPQSSNTLGEAMWPTAAYIKGPRPPNAALAGIADSKYGIVIRSALNTSAGSFPLMITTVVHEMGHVIGLGHVPLACAATQSVMIPRYEGTASLTPRPNDRTGITRLIGSRQN